MSFEKAFEMTSGALPPRKPTGTHIFVLVGGSLHTLKVESYLHPTRLQVSLHHEESQNGLTK